MESHLLETVRISLVVKPEAWNGKPLAGNRSYQFGSEARGMEWKATCWKQSVSVW